MSSQTVTDRVIAEHFFTEQVGMQSSAEDDTPIRLESFVEDLNGANSKDGTLEDGILGINVKELLDFQRKYDCHKQLKGGKEIESIQELRPGDYLAVKTKSSRLWWNYMIVVEVIQEVIYAVCLCAPHQDLATADLVSDYSTSWQRLQDPFKTSLPQLKIWEIPLRWCEVRNMIRYDHLSCTDIIEEARKELGTTCSWKLHEKILEKATFRLT